MLAALGAAALLTVLVPPPQPDSASVSKSTLRHPGRVVVMLGGRTRSQRVPASIEFDDGPIVDGAADGDGALDRDM
jgi:hypothetical protein